MLSLCFVEVFNGDLGGLDGADGICRMVAQSPMSQLNSCAMATQMIVYALLRFGEYFVIRFNLFCFFFLFFFFFVCSTSNHSANQRISSLTNNCLHDVEMNRIVSNLAEVSFYYFFLLLVITCCSSGSTL